MARRSIVAIAAVSLAACVITAMGDLVNEDVKRVIDVTGTIAVSRTTVRMKNTGTDAASLFYLAVHKSDVDGLGDCWVTGASAGTSPRVLPVQPSTKVPGLRSCCRGFVVTLATPIPSGGEAVFDIRIDVSDRISPVPETIEKYESQYMRFVGNAYFFTPYASESMTSTIVLGSSTVASKNGLEKPFNLKDKKLALGPYKNVPAFAHKEISIRFKNDRGFLVAKRAVKEFFLNHLGKIHVKEQFDVINGGARHTGEWSRVDHATGFASKYGAVMGDVWANLPADATHVEYKDLIGNVTSSRLRLPSRGKRPVQLVFRYPLMGGWRNLFWITYKIMLKNYLSSKEHDHEVKLPMYPSLNTNLLCEEYQVRVFLPEWSWSLNVLPHESMKISVDYTSERRTLTMFGRPVVTLSMKMLRSQSKHDKTVTIRYKYNSRLAWIAPVIVAFGIMLVVVGFILAVRNALILVGIEEEASLQKLKEKRL